MRKQLTHQEIAELEFTLDIIYRHGYDSGVKDRRQGKLLDEKNIPVYQRYKNKLLDEKNIPVCRRYKNEYKKRAAQAGYKSAYGKKFIDTFGFESLDCGKRKRFMSALLKEMGIYQKIQ